MNIMKTMSAGNDGKGVTKGVTSHSNNKPTSREMTSTAELVARKECISVGMLPDEVAVIDCEKRRGSSNYYTYIIQVTRKNGEVYYIYRRYRKFHKMTQRLEERFPVESGAIRASDRIIPSLPGKKYVGRSAIRDVAQLRQPHLDEFLKKLYKMSDKIRYDSIVLGFLKPNHEDVSRPYKPSVAYHQPLLTRTTSSPLNKPKPIRPAVGPKLSIPVVQVTSERSGKVPPPRPAPPRPSPPRASSPKPIRGPRAKVKYDYSPLYDDELPLVQGDIVPLIRKVGGAWYEGKVNGQIGLIPGNYLDIIEEIPIGSDDSSEGDDTDEWDDNDGNDNNGNITCYYKGKPTKVELDDGLIKRPTYVRLLFALRGKLRDSNITMNYKDPTGDLIEITNDEDLILMRDNNIKPNSFTLYISKTGDYTVYNTKP